ncbi:MAG: TPM domain-containing protein, partial [Bacteroidales bacterium]|nr:TPM domain-containing protein [Bacteroidales bacterium]
MLNRTLLWLLLLTMLRVQAQVPERPDPPRLVNDLAGLLSPEQIATMESMLVAFNDSTSNQLAVVILTDLMGYDKAELAYRIGQEWGVGQK